MLYLRATENTTCRVLNTALTVLTHGDRPPALGRCRWKQLLNHWLSPCKCGTVCCSAWFCSGLQLWGILSAPRNPIETQSKTFCKIFINSKNREIEKIITNIILKNHWYKDDIFTFKKENDLPFRFSTFSFMSFNRWIFAAVNETKQNMTDNQACFTGKKTCLYCLDFKLLVPLCCMFWYLNLRQ